MLFGVTWPQYVKWKDSGLGIYNKFVGRKNCYICDSGAAVVNMQSFPTITLLQFELEQNNISKKFWI